MPSRKPPLEPPPPPSQVADKYIVRFPDGMRDKLAAAAKVAGRSMNSEIVSRLEASFSSADRSFSDDHRALVRVLAGALVTPGSAPPLKRVLDAIAADGGEAAREHLNAFGVAIWEIAGKAGEPTVRGASFAEWLVKQFKLNPPGK